MTDKELIADQGSRDEKWLNSPEADSQLFSSSSVGISISSIDRFNYANPKFAEIVGYSMNELLQMGPLDLVPSLDRAQVANMLKLSLAGSGNFSVTIHIRRKDNSLKLAELTGGISVGNDGSPKLITMLAEVTEQHLADNQIGIINARLREQAMRDPLTGLFNRRYLEESLSRELARAERSRKPLGLIMGDLDHFKHINDTYGHQNGDEVLREVGDILKRYSRSSDIPCRYGGEEFLLVLPDICESKACERAELLRNKLSSISFRFNESEVHLSASFGIASFPKDARDADKLISVVDSAMYQAKAAGRNQICIAEPSPGLFPSRPSD